MKLIAFILGALIGFALCSVVSVVALPVSPIVVAGVFGAILAAIV